MGPHRLRDRLVVWCRAWEADVSYAGEVKVSGVRVIINDMIVSETGSCVVGSIAWLDRQKQLREAEKKL